MGIYDDIKDYDEDGNWKRDYMDMKIPIDELALPRNEEEAKLYNKRFSMEFNFDKLKALAEIPYKYRPDGENTIKALEEGYYESEEEFLNEQAELSNRTNMEY